MDSLGHAYRRWGTASILSCDVGAGAVVVCIAAGAGAGISVLFGAATLPPPHPRVQAGGQQSGWRGSQGRGPAHRFHCHPGEGAQRPAWRSEAWLAGVRSERAAHCSGRAQSPTTPCLAHCSYACPPARLPPCPQIVYVLRHYPVGRLVVFAYIIGLHLFIYILLHRLAGRGQAGADAPMASRNHPGATPKQRVHALPQHAPAGVVQPPQLLLLLPTPPDRVCPAWDVCLFVFCCRLQHRAFHSELSLEALHRDERI